MTFIADSAEKHKKNSKQWLNLREARNSVTHEYPFITNEIIEGLNALSDDAIHLSTIWKHLKSYCEKRFNLQTAPGRKQQSVCIEKV